MQFDSLEIQKNIEEKRLILGQKFADFLARRLIKISDFLASILNSKKTAKFGAIFIILTSIWCQSLRDLGHDSSTYPEIAQKILVGGEYFKDFLESNLPLNFTLTAIPVLVAQKFNFNIFATAQIFWNLLGILSIFWSAKILRRSKLLTDQTVFNLLFLGLVAGFFWRVFTLQFNEFGTKTTYLLAALIPYISYQFIDEKNPRNSDQIFIGILAGFLFCIKPHYGIFVVTFELTKLIKSRNIFALFCLRNYTTLAILITNLIWIFFAFPDYIRNLSVLSSAYYNSASSLIFIMFMQDIFPIILVGILSKNLIQKEEVLARFVPAVFAAGLLILSEIIGGLDQRYVFYSASLPALLLIVFFLIKNRLINFRRDWIFLCAIIFLAQFDPQNIFGLTFYLTCFWWVFALIFFRNWQISQKVKILLFFSALATIGLLISDHFTHTPWTISLFIFAFIVNLNQKSYEKNNHTKELSRLSACLIFMVLSYFISLNLAAIFNLKTYYDSHKFSSPNHFNSEIIKVVKSYSDKDESVIAISEGIPGFYPSIAYAGKKNELPFLQYQSLFRQIKSSPESMKSIDLSIFERVKNQLKSPTNKIVFIEIQHYAQKDRCLIGFLEYYFFDEEFRKIFLENYAFLTRVINVAEISSEIRFIDHEFEVYVRKN
jgi:hypothetical protein